MKKIVTYSIVLGVLLMASCIEKPTYPSTPVIAYKDFIRYGDPLNPDSVELVVSFTDNEGDIGLAKSDTFGLFHTGNLFMDMLYWDTTGTDHWAYYDNTPPDTLPFDTFRVAYRIPPVLPEGDPAEPMKGLIYAKQQAPVNIFNKIQYVVYMYDKAHHKSDTIHTPTIYF